MCDEHHQLDYAHLTARASSFQSTEHMDIMSYLCVCRDEDVSQEWSCLVLTVWTRANAPISMDGSAGPCSQWWRLCVLMPFHQIHHQRLQQLSHWIRPLEVQIDTDQRSPTRAAVSERFWPVYPSHFGSCQTHSNHYTCPTWSPDNTLTLRTKCSFVA